jgi:RHS repeat-associated protein
MLRIENRAHAITMRTDFITTALQVMCSRARLNASRYTGKERDAESGLDYFGARYYSSSMGRFSSPDPSGLFYADPANPQSLNLYSYAQNNPLTNVDPTGLDCAYFNDSGDGIESVDKNSSGSECGANGGNWVNGTLTGAQYFSGSDTWGLQSRDSSNSYLTYASAPGTQSDGTTCNGDCDKANGYSQTSLGGVSDVPLNPYALGVIQGVAQQTAWVPNICGVGVTARVGLPGSRLSAGVDLSSQNGINGAGGARIAQVGNVQGSVSVKGKSVSATVTAPIPGTPFVGGVSTKGSGISSVSVGVTLVLSTSARAMQEQAPYHPTSRTSAPLAVCLLLPIMGCLRQRGKQFSALTVLIFLLSGAALLSLDGCGGSSSASSGLPTSFEILVTATSGSLSHSSSVSLTVK